MQDSRRQEARDQRREATRDQRLSSGHSDGSGAGTGAAGSPTQGLLRDERVVRPGDMGVEMRSRSPELAVRPELVRDTGTVRSRGLPVPQGGKGRSGDGVMQYVHVTKKG